jgi:hypothetical protein
VSPTRSRSRQWFASAVTLLTVAAMTTMVSTALAAGAATTTTSTTTSIAPPSSTTTTLVCPVLVQLSHVELSPSTFAPGQQVHAVGHLYTDVQVGCDFLGFNGPHPILLVINGQVITLAVVNLVDGNLDADLIIPASITARGPGDVMFEVAPVHPQLAQAVLVVNPAAPALPVQAHPALTG